MQDAGADFKVYPIYLDSSLSHGRGRKSSLSAGVPNPTFKEVKQALDQLGLNYSGEPEKMHPKDTRRQGRFKVSGAQSRKATLESIAAKIRELRSNTEAKVKDNSNFLNLVPRSKKKNKK